LRLCRPVRQSSAMPSFQLGGGLISEAAFRPRTQI
jgi:hypothetical protein